jgi:hypothetical protein
MTESDQPHPGAITEVELLVAQGCAISADMATKFRSLFWGEIRPTKHGKYLGITISTNLFWEPYRLFQWSDPDGFNAFTGRYSSPGPRDRSDPVKQYYSQCPGINSRVLEMDAYCGESAQFMLDFSDKMGMAKANLYPGGIPDEQLMNLHTPHHLLKVLRRQEQSFRELYPEWSRKFGCRYLGAGRDYILLKPPAEAHDLEAFLAATEKAEFPCNKIGDREGRELILLESKM